jgi:hypothetical protein
MPHEVHCDDAVGTDLAQLLHKPLAAKARHGDLAHDHGPQQGSASTSVWRRTRARLVLSFSEEAQMEEEIKGRRDVEVQSRHADRAVLSVGRHSHEVTEVVGILAINNGTF